MVDNTVLNVGVGGDTLATDDIGGVKHQRVKVEHGADGSATDASHADPFPVIAGLVAPKISLAKVTALAALGSTDLDSAQIASGKTGKLMAIRMGASVPLRGALKTVLNGAPSVDIDVFFTVSNNTETFLMPSREFVKQAESATAGFDGFRITVTNLDPLAAADAYVTFYFDEG